MAAGLALTVGCSASSPKPSATATQTPGPAGEDCPSLPPARPGVGAAIDYVDFIQANGQNYVAGLGSRPVKVRSRDLGRVVLRSRCSFSALNDRTHQNPGQARNGDTGFLPAGTAIYAVDGWPTQCRLAADSGTGMHAYLALRANAKVATPRACALHH